MPSNDARRDAVNFLCGGRSENCRLCFSPADGQLSLEDSVAVGFSNGGETITLQEIFDTLGVENDSLLPQLICIRCATNAINSFMFHQLCQHSTHQWRQFLDQMLEGTTKAYGSSSKAKTTFIHIDKAQVKVFPNRRECLRSKKFASKRFKTLMRNRQIYLGRKEINLQVCHLCGVSFDTAGKLRRHTCNTHNTLHCSYCSKSYGNTLLLQEHMERVHYTKVIKCSQCPQRFGSERILKEHVKFFHVTTTCKLCNEQLPSRRALRSHLEKHGTVTCANCNKAYDSKNSLRSHMKRCGRSIPLDTQFVCDICGKTFMRKQTIRQHIQTQHGFGKAFICSWCGKKFSAQSILDYHAVKHTREKNFQCVSCGGRFVTKSALLYHSRLHSGEKPYPCDLCEMRFLSASRRLDHKRRKHWTASFQCDICPSKFASGTTLKTHKIRHYNPKSKLYCKTLLTPISNGVGEEIT